MASLKELSGGSKLRCMHGVLDLQRSKMGFPESSQKMYMANINQLCIANFAWILFFLQALRCVYISDSYENSHVTNSINVVGCILHTN